MPPFQILENGHSQEQAPGVTPENAAGQPPQRAGSTPENAGLLAEYGGTSSARTWRAVTMWRAVALGWSTGPGLTAAPRPAPLRLARQVASPAGRFT
jgi:hypothetical protein